MSEKTGRDGVQSTAERGWVVIGDVTVYGAIFIGVLAAIAQLTGNTQLANLLRETSPIVGVASALGIGALVEYFGGAAYGLVLAKTLDGSWREDVAPTLPSYKLFEGGTTGSRLLDRRTLARLVTEYEFRQTAPAPLIEWVADRRARHRFLALATGSAAVAGWIAFAAFGFNDQPPMAKLIAGGVILSLLAAVGWVWEKATQPIVAVAIAVEERHVRQLTGSVARTEPTPAKQSLPASILMQFSIPFVVIVILGFALLVIQAATN